MRNLKKFLALVLAMMMAFSMMITVNASSDMDAAFKNAYDKLESYGVFNGYGSVGNDALGETFTRAQMAAVAYRIATGDTEDKQIDLYAQYADEEFTDVKANQWFAGYVGFCQNQGIVVGYGNGKFGPNDPVTGSQAAAMMLRLLGFGKNDEFVGKSWEVNVLSWARRYGITTGLTDSSLTATATRGVAAYIAYRGATVPDQVNYYFGGSYFQKAGQKLLLVTDLTLSDTISVWGEPTITTGSLVVFNWVVNNKEIEVTNVETNEPIWEFYGAITECDFADYLDFDGIRYAITYTNGGNNYNLKEYWTDSGSRTHVRNNSGTGVYGTLGDTAMVIQALDTVNKIGHEGRLNRVYYSPAYAQYLEDVANGDRTGAYRPVSEGPQYIIVGIDTFLGTVTSTWDEIKDPAGHVIRKAGASVNVYYNAASVNASSTASTFATANPLSLTVTGTGFTVGQKLGLHVATVPTLNTMSNTGANGNPTLNTTGAVVVDSYELTTTTVTVKSITYDSTLGAATNSTPIGFTDTNGVEYYYNYTFAGTPLDGAALNQTYILWLGADGNDVLDYQPISTGSYGVVTNAVVKQISASQYVLTYTILLPDGTEVPVDVVDDTTGTPFTTITAAENYYNGTNPAGFKFGQLVHCTSTGKYYVLDKTARIDNLQQDFKSGRAEAIGTDTYRATVGTEFVIGSGGVYKTLVNDATIFFVAEYKPDTTTPTASDPDDYVFTGYKIYTGFKTLPDLTFEAGSHIGYLETNITNLDIQAFNVVNGQAVSVGTYEYAQYVVINDATKQTTPPAKVDTLNYAFVVANDSIVNEYDGYYMFPAYLNGTYTTLQVRLNAGRGIDQNGLYAYSDFVNGEGYSIVTLMNGTNNTAPDYAAPYAGLNMKLSGGNIKYASGVLTDGTNYYTVASDAVAYLINPTKGTSSDLSLGALNVYGKNASVEVWFQLNQYGQINLMYVLDANMTGIS